MELNKRIEKVVKGVSGLIVVWALSLGSLFVVNVLKNNPTIDKNIGNSHIKHLTDGHNPLDESYRIYETHQLIYTKYFLRKIDGVISYKEVEIEDLSCLDCQWIHPGSETKLTLGDVFGRKRVYSSNWNNLENDLEEILIVSGRNQQEMYFTPEYKHLTPHIKDYEKENEFFKENIEKVRMLME
jgi:hypothetical protein